MKPGHNKFVLTHKPKCRAPMTTDAGALLIPTSGPLKNMWFDIDDIEDSSKFPFLGGIAYLLSGIPAPTNLKIETRQLQGYRYPIELNYDVIAPDPGDEALTHDIDTA